MDEHTHNVALFFGLTPEGGGVPENMASVVAKATKAAVLNAAKDVDAVKTVLDATTSRDAIGGVRYAGDRAAGQGAQRSLNSGAARQRVGEVRRVPKVLEGTRASAHHDHMSSRSSSTRISSKYRPVIELRLDGAPAGKVSFEVEVSIAFEEVSVVIRNKRFMAVRDGRRPSEGNAQVRRHANPGA